MLNNEREEVKNHVNKVDSAVEMPFQRLAVKTYSPSCNSDGKPKISQVQLMADTGTKILAQIDWDLTYQDFPELKNARHIALAVSIWEDGNTSARLAAFVHLLPDKRHSPLPNRLLRREPVGNMCLRSGCAPPSIQAGLASSQIHT
jgi:hypothetical protein